MAGNQTTLRSMLYEEDRMSLSRISALQKQEEPPSEPVAPPASPPVTPPVQQISVPMGDVPLVAYAGFNTIRRVNRTGGIIGLFKTQQHNIMDQINELNRTGYRVTFIVSDSWTFFQWLGAFLLLIVTIGIYTKTAGLLIVGERVQ
jgi:hypothetical protein